MNNQFRKEYKWIVPAIAAVIVIILCTACGKEEKEQRMMVSVLGAESPYDKWYNGMQSLNARILESRDVCKEQPEEEKIYSDEWEIEHVEAISMSFYDGVTQEDINRIGQYRHLKKLAIYIYDAELDLSPLSNLTELESIELSAWSMDDKVDVSFLSDLTELKNYLCIMLT